MTRSMEEADRLSRALVSVFACDFVLADDLPKGHWVRLPYDYREAPEWHATVKRGRPPSDLRGPVAVSIDTLRWLAQ